MVSDNNVMTESGYIFDIERYATEDGPGIRTVVFFKGCRLRCLWCQNPESQRGKPDILYYANKCAGCGRCVAGCPRKALSIDSKTGVRWNREQCDSCGVCEGNCFRDAIKLSGRLYDVAEVMRQVNRDRGFYERSGGGITISGGEPVMQGAFLAALLRAAKEDGIHTAVESCGMPSPDWDLALPYIDLLYLDYKHVDTERCKAQLGADYAPYLKNIERLVRRHANVILRIPCVPGFNHSEEDYERIAEAIAELGHTARVELLPYHRLGYDKYLGLARAYPLDGVAPVEKSELMTAASIFERHGLHAVVMPE